ncbi:hypothetical protein HDU97_001565 [Phlyctochytrium planicorne]|nr:hypothetical protein HDU97_001565 [Phlyctochytrium planicorne]
MGEKNASAAKKKDKVIKPSKTAAPVNGGHVTSKKQKSVSKVAVKSKANSGPVFRSLEATFQIYLPPYFTKNPSQGVLEYLSKFLLRYVQEVGGVILAFNNVRFLQNAAKILYDSPYSHFKVSATLTVFSPKVNSVLVGIVNKVSPDHIGLLVHGAFNASIAADQIRKKEFVWRDKLGAWKQLGVDGDVSIKPGSIIRFTVTGLTKANDILSISGSLLKDPANTGIILQDGSFPNPPIAVPTASSAPEESAEEDGQPEGITMEEAIDRDEAEVDDIKVPVADKVDKADKKQKKKRIAEVDVKDEMDVDEEAPAPPVSDTKAKGKSKKTAQVKEEPVVATSTSKPKEDKLKKKAQIKTEEEEEEKTPKRKRAKEDAGEEEVKKEPGSSKKKAPAKKAEVAEEVEEEVPLKKKKKKSA